MSKRVLWRSVMTAVVLLGLAGLVQASGRGRHKQIYAVPAPGKIVIDAELDDWDLSGQILSYVVPETQDMQSARTAMMYDGEALYICGRVRDTSPMMNRHDPRTNPEKAWDADVCQIFFSLDPDEEYPLGYSKFNKAHAEVPVGTMMLWYYTDRKEPCLAMFQGMRFNKPLQPELGERGVIDEKYYQGAYRKMEDGGGYVFEYRIPWTTMKLTRTPEPNDILALSLAVFWSRPDGLKTAGGKAWAYDVMSGPGFSFQTSDVWGKLIFWPENDVPEDLVRAGLPPEKPLPLKFTYNLPEDSEVTVQLFDEANQVVRILVPQQDRRAGKNTELWDGLNDQGKPLPAGTYTWKGVYHEPIRTQWRFSVHNSGQPPYPTDDNTGGWGGDHGSPQTVVAIEDGMILSWNVCEYGWGIIRVDLQGRKLWGSKHSATYMAADGKRLFIAGGHGFHNDPNVRILDLKDSRPISLANGKPSYAAPEGGTPKTNHVTGLDCHDGTLYVAYGERDLIAAFNIEDAALKETYDVPAPQRLAVRPDGTLAVLSGGKVVAVDGESVSDLVTDHLDDPVGVAVGPDGTLYVTNRGARQNVSVFDAGGAYLRSLGKPGGRPAVGRYDPSGMYMAGGLDVGAEGRVWVAETTDGPKRVSVWDAETGENLEEYFGSSGYFGYGYILPHQPDMMYAHHVLWKIDWEALKGYPHTTIWRKTEPNMMDAPSPSGYNGVMRFIEGENGRHYAWGNARHKNVLLRREGDLYKPFAAMLRISRGGTLYRGQKLPVLDDEEAFPNGQYFWQDANDDQTVQADEVEAVDQFGRGRVQFAWLEKDLSAWIGTGHRLTPVEVRENGQPVYDLDQAEETFAVGREVPVRHGYFTRDQAGNTYTFRNSKGPSLVKWSPEGERLWYYADIEPWRKALSMPITGPGRLWGMTGCMGLAGRYLVHQTYFGTNHLFRDDGMYVAALLQDGRVGGPVKKKGGDTKQGQPEGQNGTFVRLTLDGEERYFVIHGGQDSRVWEVLGLETVRDLEGGTYEHTEDLVATARNALKEYNAAIAKSQRMTIARGHKALEVVEPVGRAVDSKRSFEARAAYDEKNLYLVFDVVTSNPLINAEPEPKLVFRGGNCLDIQIATDPEADPERETPAPGDLRLLITRKENKPFAMLYEPTVKDFEGEPVVFTSPTGQESFDRITEFKDFEFAYKPTRTGFQAAVTIPQKALGLTLEPGMSVKMDLGYIFGNAEGTRTAVRAYAKNSSFTAGVTKDIPHESRLEPAEWGDAVVE
jgi:hypothetical protein